MTKYQLRRWWFQAHKWIGITLAVLIIPLSLSGAALVWHDALDRLVNPVRYATSGTTLLDADAYLAAARARLAPGDRVAQLSFPEHGRGPVTVAAAPAPRADGAPARPGPPARTTVYLDPPTARVLDVAGAGGLVRFIHVLHGSLQVPGGWGRTLVGWLGVAMLVSSISGLWLWWPTTGRWARGLRWRRRPDLNSNLHHQIGFWICVPLFVLSLTGAWIAFPGFFGALIGEARGRGGPERGGFGRAAPVAAARLPVHDAIARATALVHGPVRSVTWPTEKTPDWSVRVGERTVSVADDDAVAALAPPREGQGGVARLMRRLHSGEGMGPVWQVIVFGGGIAPAVLAVTGLVMWWRSRGWRRRATPRRA